jgi:endonuclease I/chitodextrinase
MSYYGILVLIRIGINWCYKIQIAEKETHTMVKKTLFFLSFLTAIHVTAQQAYYNDVNIALTGIQLKNELATKITATHTNTLHYTPDVWTASKITDANPNNTNEVLLYYGWENGLDGDDTNDLYRDNTLQDTGSGHSFRWNREHVYAKSLANPNLETDTPGAGTDVHNLRPVDKTRNSTRNNLKFGAGSGIPSGFSSVTYAGPLGLNTNAWFPGDEWKGDVARIVMYMYLRYGNQCVPTAVGVGNTQFTPDEMIDLFLQWNVEDPVSDIEKNRNDYHENTSNSAAQGNRNPFIDNPYLATRIWGGDSAQDIWGIYTSSDTEKPTTPTNVIATNKTVTSIDLSWTAATDNIGVTGYNIYLNDVLTSQTTNTTITIYNLTPNTPYVCAIEAKDLINNKSTKSTLVHVMTLEDVHAPTIPTNILSSTISDTTFKLTWDAATDNTAVTGYDIFVDAIHIASTNDTTYTVTGLTKTTTYTVTILAKDAADNTSSQSTAIHITTTDGASNGITEIFISEYIEPSSGNNKAIEIANVTSSSIDLTGYSIKKQSNGGSWIDDLPLTKTAFLVNPSTTEILPNDVFVIIHGNSADLNLTNTADLIVHSNLDAPYKFGSPLNFNGNDPIGLFKDGQLIDIVGEENNSSNHIQDVTLRRKPTISNPNTTYNTNEWETLTANTFNGIGNHTATLSVESVDNAAINIYPNPLTGNYLTIIQRNTQKIATIKVYNTVGQEVLNFQNPQNTINLTDLQPGMYMLKCYSEEKISSRKLIKQ